MHIKILGTGCAKCKNLEKRIRDVVAAHNIDAVVTKVSDMESISKYGIVMTPGVVIDEQLVSIGSVLSESHILFLLKEASK